MRGLMALLVGPVLGEPTPHFPLYLVEALLVELDRAARAPAAAASRSPAARRIGTVGLAAEWGWTHVWMPLPWPAALVPEGVVLGLAMAVAGACVGALAGRAAEPPTGTPSLRWAGVAGARRDLRAGRLRADLDRHSRACAGRSR